jgi:hypothetical protein
MNVVRTSAHAFLIFTLVTAWLFGGWPQVWENPSFPPKIQPVQAATLTAACATAANQDLDSGAAWTTAGACDGSNDTRASFTVTGLGAGDYLVVSNFNFSSIPNGSTVNGIEVLIERNGDTNGANSVIDNSIVIRKADGTLGSTNKATSGSWSNTDETVTRPTSGGSTDTWDLSWTVGDGDPVTDIKDADFGVAISGKGAASGGNKTVAGRIDNVQITIYYTPPNSAPNAPSQDAPANSATGVSVTPTFTMTATDPDSDDVSYKVTIYSNSACSSAVSTHDQAVTQTGWSGTDATCTNSPTSCYASGTQGSFVLQAGDALSNSTEYWWKASAKDPDGAGTFTDSASCNSFTTVSANSLPSASAISIDSGATSVTLTENTTKNVTCEGTVTDTDGFADIDSVTADFYRTSVGTSSPTDANNYYQLSGDGQCVPSNGSGNTEDYSCTFSVEYYADPTDTGSPNAGDDWTCTMTPSDGGGQGGSADDTIEMASLIALDVTSSINYGSVDADTDTGSSNETVTVTNTGNRDMDPQISGTAMTSGDDTIAVGRQEYSDAAFTWGSGTDLTGSAVTLNLTLPQRTAGAITDTVYWGIGVPGGTPAGTYTGTNTFSATAGI